MEKYSFTPNLKLGQGQTQTEEHEERLSKSSGVFDRLPEIISCPGLISSLLPFFPSPFPALAEASLQANIPPVSNPNTSVPHFPADTMRNSMEKVKGQVGAVPVLQNTATAGNGLQKMSILPSDNPQMSQRRCTECSWSGRRSPRLGAQG